MSDSHLAKEEVMIDQDRPPQTELQSEESGPDWAQGHEEHGRDRWRARTDERRRSLRQSGYIAAVVINAIFLAVVHSLLSWHVPFITSAWPDVLWAIDLSVGGSIVANAVFVAYDERWFRGLVQIGVTALSLVAVLTLVQVFPFDFGSPSWNDLAHFAGDLLVFAIAIAIIVQAIVWIVDQARRAVR